MLIVSRSAAEVVVTLTGGLRLPVAVELIGKSRRWLHLSLMCLHVYPGLDEVYELSQQSLQTLPMPFDE